jgi:tetratricopeptide (TPR) repeat protein
VRIVGNDVDAADVYFLAASSFWKAGDAENTVAMYELAISLYEGAVAQAKGERPQLLSNLAAWHSSLGLALTELGRFDEAIVHYGRSTALGLDPVRQLTVRGYLAYTYGEMGEYSLAEREHKKVWDERSSGKAGQFDRAQLARALDNWAVALFKDGNVDEGISQLERAAHMFPPEALDARRRNAASRLIAYRVAGRYRESAKVFREAWKLTVEQTRQINIDHFRNGYRSASRELEPSRAKRALSISTWRQQPGGQVTGNSPSGITRRPSRSPERPMMY